MKKVLLTSSSQAFLKRNENLLTGKGFHLVTATNGAEALKLHRQQLFDLILSDLELEDSDGCTLCTAVHTAEPSFDVTVVLICRDTAECLAKVKQSDADAILLRPVDPTQLLVTIGSFIDMQLARSKRIACMVAASGRKHDTEFSCISHDISSTGILLGTDFELSAGDRISVAFKLPDSTQIQTDAEVARCINSLKGTSLYGIKYIDLPLSRRNAINKFISLNNHLGVMQQPPHPLKKRGGKSVPDSGAGQKTIS